MASTATAPAELRLLVLASSAQSTTSKDIPRQSDDTKSVLSSFLQDLTGTPLSPDLQTFAGYTSHPPIQFRNKYYDADVNIWCDELPNDEDDNESSLSDWRESMCSEQAREVREVIGGVIILLSAHSPSQSDNHIAINQAVAKVQAVHELKEMIEDDFGREVAAVVVVPELTSNSQRNTNNKSPSTFAEQLEDTCIEAHGIFGWDIIPWTPQKDKSATESNSETDAITAQQALVNGHGEKIGIERVLEVLEQMNWSASVANADLPDDLSDTSDILAASSGFNVVAGPVTRNPETDELQREMLGLHFALEDQSQRQTDDGEDTSIQQLAGLMDRVVATREAASELPEAEKKQFAKREISKMLRDMNLA